MVYILAGGIESGRVPHIDYLNCKAISYNNKLMKFERNSKSLRGSYKKLCGIKSILLGLKLYRGGI